MIVKTLLSLALTTMVVTAQAENTFKLKYLRNVTPEEVLPVALKKMNVDIENSFGGEAPLFIDSNSFKDFKNLKYGYASDLNELTGKALKSLGKTEFTYSEFIEALSETVYKAYDLCSIYVSGKKVVVTKYESKNVDQEECSFLNGYLGDSLDEARFNKAMKLAKNTSAYKIKDLFEMWGEGVSNDGKNLDSFFELPRLVVGDYNPEALFGALGNQGYELLASGQAAIDAFFSGGEAPEALYFQDMIKVLKSSKTAQFYFFAGGGENFSRYSLMIVDEHNQVYSFTMGYSE